MRVLVGLVEEGVGEVGRRGDEAAGRRADPVGLAAQHERQLASDHVEGVRVLAMDVQIGPALSRPIAHPRDRDVVPFGQDDEVAVLSLGDRLTLAGPGDDTVSFPR